MKGIHLISEAGADRGQALDISPMLGRLTVSLHFNVHLAQGSQPSLPGAVGAAGSRPCPKMIVLRPICDHRHLAPRQPLCRCKAQASTSTRCSTSCTDSDAVVRFRTLARLVMHRQSSETRSRANGYSSANWWPLYQMLLVRRSSRLMV